MGENKLAVFFMGLSLVLLILFLFSYITAIGLLKQNEIYETILYGDSQLYGVSETIEKAEAHYLEATYSYADGDYNSVESNCRLARNYYSQSSEQYLDVFADLKSRGVDSDLVNIYIQSVEVLAEIQLNMFEACEHFESASRSYDKYYNTNVSPDDSSFEIAGAEIEMMNEKIALHDENVRKYNKLLSEYKIKLEELMR